MEHIQRAVELAKSRGNVQAGRPVPAAPYAPTDAPASNSPAPQSPRRDLDWAAGAAPGPEPRVVTLDSAQLETMRIIAHDVMDRRSKSYDMLRTQVLRTMDQQRWQLLAVTSPTPGCGKTLTAINLALSIARQPEKSVLLVDLDLQRPRIAGTLGLKCDIGLLGVLEEQAGLHDAVIEAQIGKVKLKVLPCEKSTSHSSEWMSSRQMSSLIHAIRNDFNSHVVVLDMPPILTSDDVISILPQLDCALLVAAVGVTTMSDIEQCNRHLHSAEVVRVILNKSADTTAGYYY
jgi:Mrp family chromosome partitioning ATPase